MTILSAASWSKVRYCMSDQLVEWIQKAEADYEVAHLLMSSNKIHVDAACFHAQQAVEKYLKAILVSHSVLFEKTHNLVFLLDLVLPHQPLWESWRSAF